MKSENNVKKIMKTTNELAVERNELAFDRTVLAETRTKLAYGRSIFALERTFAAWIRTGFSIAGFGATIAGILKTTNLKVQGEIFGSILLVMGVLSFIYAWVEFYRGYRDIHRIFPPKEHNVRLFRLNLFYASFLACMLLLVSLSGIFMIWYNS